MYTKNINKGFTLIELLVVIGIIGLIITMATYSFLNVRTKARDAQRSRDAATIRSALELYLNNDEGYPVSDGECINLNSEVVNILNSKDYIVPNVLKDPLWASIEPTVFHGGTEKKDYAIDSSHNFCYWYYGETNRYYLSYYLENISQNGKIGIQVYNQNGIVK